MKGWKEKSSLAEEWLEPLSLALTGDGPWGMLENLLRLL